MGAVKEKRESEMKWRTLVQLDKNRERVDSKEIGQEDKPTLKCLPG